jgi:hypothetical protein
VKTTARTRSLDAIVTAAFTAHLCILSAAACALSFFAALRAVA